MEQPSRRQIISDAFVTQSAAMPVQQTFTLIPEARARAAANTPIRPMTSKQVKKAHKQANQQPKLSRQEQRRLELAEQERIRKELEKDRQAARARAARERKKEKELANKEAKRKLGKPLVDVRPSQDTIARFVRGNGTGKKRDVAGKEVTQKTALPIVAEEADDQGDTETEDENTLHVEEDEAKTESERKSPSRRQPEPQLPVLRTSQRMSQRQPSSSSRAAPSQPPKKPRLLSQRKSSQPGNEASPPRRADQHSIESSSGHDRAAASNRKIDQALHQDAIGKPEQAQHGAKSPSQCDRILSEGGILDEFPQPSALIEDCEPCQEPGLSGRSQREDRTRSKRPLQRCESFRLDLDDIIDDDSLLQLDAVADHIASPAQRFNDNERHEMDEPTASHQQQADVPQDTAKQESQSSLDFDMLENMNAIFDDLTSLPCPTKSAQLPVANDTLPELVIEPPGPSGSPSTTAQCRNGLKRISSYADDGLDDDTLLGLDEVELSFIDNASRSGTKANHMITNRKIAQLTSYERDLGLAPKLPPPWPLIPLSTQAILSEVDDFFPSPSQQARELDGLPVPNSGAEFTQGSPTMGKEQAAPMGSSATASSPKQKRFFTASGGELVSLAMQRSRRDAKREEIHEKERQRREAGQQEQARKRAMREHGVQKHGDTRKPLSQKMQTRTSLPLNLDTKKPLPQPEHKVSSTPPRFRPCRLSMTSPRVCITAPAPPSNLTSTFKAIGTANKASQSRTNFSEMISDDKENHIPKPANAGSDKHGAPSASQETEYGGGDWMDDAWTDFEV